MTHLPSMEIPLTYIPPVKATTVAGPLADANTVIVMQNGVSKAAALSVFKTWLLATASASTGTSSGTGTGTSTGTTTTTATTSPAGRLGYAAATTAVKNTATTPVAVTVPAAPSRSLPAYTATNSAESPNGTVIDSTNYSTGSITYGDGTKLTLIPSPAVSGTYRVQINGGALAGRVNLENFNSTNMDGVITAVYYYHRTYIKTNYGHPGGDTWLVCEGTSAPITDCDTEADDPRVTFLVADSVAPAGDPVYGLGTHPGSIGDEPRFSQYIAEFKAEIGTPSYVNGFLPIDVFSNWGNSAYTAAQSLAASPVGKGCIPVVGMPMASSGRFGPPANQGDFNDFINGVNDANITAAVTNWLAFFDEVHIRPGYEMNGTFMAWFWGGQGSDTVTPPLWVAAFKHIYTVCHAAAASAATTAGKPKVVAVTWNPCHQNYNSGPNPTTMYPGNDYCDYHGLDIYSPQYTQDDTNWTGGAAYPHRNDANGNDDQLYWRIPQALEPVNRVHFWDYPGGKSANPTGGTTGWGMQDAIAFAKSCGKPLAIPECGAGSPFADRGIGPAEDDTFPHYLRSRLDQASNEGVPALYANLWVGDEKDGGWGCLYRQRTKTAIAWASAFGGTGAALKYAVGGSAASGGTTTTSGGSGGTTTTTPTAPYSTAATAVITDYNGVSATIALNAQPPMNFYSSTTLLACNIYYFVGTDGSLILDGSADAEIVSAAITQNGAKVVSLMPGTTYK